MHTIYENTIMCPDLAIWLTLLVISQVIYIYLFIYLPYRPQHFIFFSDFQQVTLVLAYLLFSRIKISKYFFKFLFFYFTSKPIEPSEEKIRSHLGPVTQVSGRICEAKPEAKSLPLTISSWHTLPTLSYWN